MHQSFKPLFAPGNYLADESQYDDLAAHARVGLRKLFGLVDAALAEHPWLTGEKRSIADPYLYVLLRWARATRSTMRARSVSAPAS